MFTLLSNETDLQSAGTGVYFRPQQTMLLLLRLLIWNLFKALEVREMRPSLQLNHCYHAIDDVEGVQHVRAHCNWSDSPGAQLEAVQEGVI